MNAERKATPNDDSQRIDKWLWAARFFKTRSAAAQAVSGGKVDADGARVKPARPVRPGSILQIRRGVTEFEVVVRGICAQRRPASEAVLLYEETQRSIERRNAEKERQAQAEHRRQSRIGRPDKHTRREMVRLKEQS